MARFPHRSLCPAHDRSGPKLRYEHTSHLCACPAGSVATCPRRTPVHSPRTPRCPHERGSKLSARLKRRFIAFTIALANLTPRVKSFIPAGYGRRGIISRNSAATIARYAESAVVQVTRRLADVLASSRAPHRPLGRFARACRSHGIKLSILPRNACAGRCIFRCVL